MPFHKHGIQIGPSRSRFTLARAVQVGIANGLLERRAINLKSIGMVHAGWLEDLLVHIGPILPPCTALDKSPQQGKNNNTVFEKFSLLKRKRIIAKKWKK